MAAVNAPLTPIEESALRKAGPCSMAFFSWVTPYIVKGFKQTLEEKDVSINSLQAAAFKSRNCFVCSYLT